MLMQGRSRICSVVTRYEVSQVSDDQKQALVNALNMSAPSLRNITQTFRREFAGAKVLQKNEIRK